MYHRWKHCFLLQDVYCIISTERKRERDDLSVGPTNLNLTWLHRAAQNSLGQPETKQISASRRLLGTKPSFSNAIDKQVPQPNPSGGRFFPLGQCYTPENSTWNPPKMQIWKMNKDDVPLKNVRGGFFAAKNRQNHFQGVKTDPSWHFFPSHELGVKAMRSQVIIPQRSSSWMGWFF